MSTPMVDDRAVFGAELIDAIINRGRKVVAFNNPQPDITTQKQNYEGWLMLGFDDPKDPQRRRPFQLKKTPEDPRLLAYIYTHNPGRGATPNHWIVDVWGEEDTDETIAFVEDLARGFDADVQFLVHNWPTRYVRRSNVL